jgi:hypothetical protein
MPLRIAFDLDGVLADMESELVRQAEILFGEAMTRRLQERVEATPASPGNATTRGTAAGDRTGRSSESQNSAEKVSDDVPPIVKLDMTERQQRQLWRHVESIENFWESLAEIEPGAVARLASAATQTPWEVIFLTKRPGSAGATAQVQTQRWLEAKGFRLPSVYVVQRSRGRIADALGLDFVVDDRPENCLDVVLDSKARAILVWREDEKNLPPAARRLGIGVVKSVEDCINILTQLDAPAEERPGVVKRVLRLLGLKEPAQVS